MTSPNFDSAIASYNEAQRALHDAREFVAANRHRLHEIYEDVLCPPMTIAEHLAEAKADPVRWAQLCKEWNDG